MGGKHVTKKYKVNTRRLALFLLGAVLGLAGAFYLLAMPEPATKGMETNPSFLHTIHLWPGQRAVIDTAGLPAGIRMGGMDFYSGDAEIATVTPDGTVTANATGDVNVYALDKNLKLLLIRVSVREKRTIYLTFDDGPSEGITRRILDILDRYHIKATFFVVGQYVNYYPNIIQEMSDRGHSIAVHSNTHNYGSIYQSGATLLDDAMALERKIIGITGEKPSLYRFPGGSYEAWRRLGVTGYQGFLSAIHKKDYRVFDWSCSLGDTSPRLKTAEALYNSALKRFSDDRHVVFLAHDMENKDQTPQAIELLIRHCLAEGYSFDVLDNFPGELIYQ